jgi:ribosome biogenesis GTPase
MCVEATAQPRRERLRRVATAPRYSVVPAARLGLPSTPVTHGEQAERPRGRVVRIDRGSAEVRTDGRSLTVLDPGGRLLVGDWVDLDTTSAPSAVVAVHPRSGVLTRAAADRTSDEQGLAANVDVVLVVEPVDPAPSLGRIERLLVLAWSSGAVPLVVLTKSDLAHDLAGLASSAQSAAPGVEVLTVSAQDGGCLDALRDHLGPGRTFALLGPSGAGKSTLVNALAGGSPIATAKVRGDGRGRHTTTRRELVELPDGSCLIDTPGLRAVGVVGDATDVDDVFPEITRLALDCRFRDCAHDSEPSCAVNAAVADGSLPARRLSSWRTLQKEIAYQRRRGDARLAAEERATWKAISKQRRSRPSTRQPR